MVKIIDEVVADAQAGKFSDEELALAKRMIDGVDPADLALWGWPREHVFAALEDAGGVAPPEPVLAQQRRQRQVEAERKREYMSLYIPHLALGLKEMLELSDRQETVIINRLNDMLEKTHLEA